jgi:hypothetical protein
MEHMKIYSECNNLGIKLLNNGINNEIKSDIENSIQYFSKAIAAAEIEGIQDFSIAKKNLETAKNELKKLKKI